MNIVNDTDITENDISVNCTTSTTNQQDFQQNSTNLADIPAKEIIIVMLMLSLWMYSIILTRRAWYQFLKE